MSRQVNLKAQHVDYNRFYIPDVTTLVDIQEDYLKWFLSKAEIVSHAAACSVFLYRPEIGVMSGGSFSWLVFV